MFPAKDKLTILFAHVAYRMQERFALRNTGVASIEARTREEVDARIAQADVLLCEASYLTSPDPMPVVTRPMSTPAALNDYIAGDQGARGNSTGMSWFRVYRDGLDTFVITCGAGGSLGFNNWDEVQGAQAQGLFNNDLGMFLALLDDEVRMWYRVQWSAAVATPQKRAICWWQPAGSC